jgi:hypothetical protein
LRVDRRLDLDVSATDVMSWAHRHAQQVAAANDVSVDVELEDLCLASRSDARDPLVSTARDVLDPDGANAMFPATTDARFCERLGRRRSSGGLEICRSLTPPTNGCRSASCRRPLVASLVCTRISSLPRAAAYEQQRHLDPPF